MGSVYDVLSLGVFEHRQVLLRMIGDEPSTPALYDLSDFEIVDGGLPSSWIVSPIGKDGFALEPESWSQADFWERYFNRDPEAVESFERERTIILDEGRARQ